VYSVLYVRQEIRDNTEFGAELMYPIFLLQRLQYLRNW